MSLSKQILTGLASGVAVGLFFGEKVAFLRWPARGFVELLQVTVLPYLVVSLVAGIASGTPQQARRLASRGSIVMVLFWVLALALVFLSPMALPDDKGGSFYAIPSVTEAASIDWLGLYIPSNPFYSLANNVVPAVVVFSVLLGIALLATPGKERILGPLAIVNAMLGRAGTLLVNLTPLGLFAIAGHSAGTLRLEEFERLQAFFLLFAGLSLLLTLALLPGIVAALTGISYRRILSRALDPLLTAFFTANLFIVLPLLAERGKELMADAGLTGQEADESVDVLVPTSFTFPHSAKLLSISFVLFAGWYAGSPVGASHYATLTVAGVLSLFGSLNVAIPFLLDLVRLPADLAELFLVSSVVNSRFGSAAAAMHTLALALLGAFFMAGRLRLDTRRLAAFALGSVVLVATFFAGSHALLARTLPEPEAAGATLDRLRLTGDWGNVAPMELLAAAPPASESAARGERLAEILRRGTLRFGFTDEQVPWSFRNSRGEVVGVDVGLANAMAFELNVRLEVVPLAGARLEDLLESGQCDIGAGRVRMDRASRAMFSRPYATEAWAFLVEDHNRDLFADLDTARGRAGLRIAVLPVREWVERLKLLLPSARIVEVNSIADFARAAPGTIDAMFTGFERASAYSLLYPRLSAVVPSPGLGSVPLAFLVPRHEGDFLAFVNAWVEDQQSNGLIKSKIDYWIRGEGARAEREPRWSFGRNVLGWWE